MDYLCRKRYSVSKKLYVFSWMLDTKCVHIFASILYFRFFQFVFSANFFETEISNELNIGRNIHSDEIYFVETLNYETNKWPEHLTTCGNPVHLVKASRIFKNMFNNSMNQPFCSQLVVSEVPLFSYELCNAETIVLFARGGVQSLILSYRQQPNCYRFPH